MEQIILNKLKTLDKKYTKSGSNYVLTTCLNPEHKDSHPSFSINTDTGFGFCFTCGFKVEKDFWGVKLDKEMKRLNNISQWVADFYSYKEVKNTQTNVILPPNSGKTLFEVLGKTWRGLDTYFLESLGIYYCDSGRYKNRLIFPFYYNNKLVAFSSRSLDSNEKLKYIHSYGFDSKALVYPYNYIKQLNKDYVVLVEGVMDSLSLLSLGIPSIPNFGVAMNIGQQKIVTLLELGVSTIYIMLDRDEAGGKAMVEFLNNKKLKEYFEIKPAIQLDNIYVQKFYKTNVKDFSEFYENKLIKG